MAFSLDRLCRHADDGLSVGNILVAGDDGIGADDRVVADSDGCDQDGAGSQASSGANAGRVFRTPSKLAVTTVAPILVFSPTSESPRYARWRTIVPAPTCDCLISTKAPTSTPSPKTVPSRRCVCGPMRHPAADLDGTGDNGEGVNDRVGADRCSTVDVGVAWVDDGDTFRHPVVLDSRLHGRSGQGQVLTGVDAEDIVSLQDVEGDALSSHRHETLRGVGEVVLALGVAGTDLVEGVPEFGQLEDVAARVDLFDGTFFGRAIAFFDDAEKTAGRVAKDPAETHRVVHNGGAEQAGGLVDLLAFEEVSQRLGPKQRFIADQDEQQALCSRLATAGKPLTAWPVPSCSVCVAKRMSGSSLEALANLVGCVADHDDDGLGPGASSRVDDVMNHRPAADLVKDLGLF